jgi:hypothetical protein
MCETKNCPKVFCLTCIGEDKVPRGQWHCPVHYCDEPKCGKKSKIFCQVRSIPLTTPTPLASYRKHMRSSRDHEAASNDSSYFTQTCPNSFCSKGHIINGPQGERVDADTVVPSLYSCWECVKYVDGGASAAGPAVVAPSGDAAEGAVATEMALDV